MKETEIICYTKIDDNIFKLLESNGFKYNETNIKSGYYNIYFNNKTFFINSNPIGEEWIFDDLKKYFTPKSVISKSLSDKILTLYICTIKHKATKSTESLYVVSEDIAKAEKKLKHFIKENNYIGYEIISYEILGESYIYTGNKKLII